MSKLIMVTAIQSVGIIEGCSRGRGLRKNGRGGDNTKKSSASIFIAGIKFADNFAVRMLISQSDDRFCA